jgi:hypothetical protein
MQLHKRLEADRRVKGYAKQQLRYFQAVFGVEDHTEERQQFTGFGKKRWSDGL